MPPECTESGCGQAGRWMVGERTFCASHGIQASTRGSVAMRLVCPIVEDEPAPSAAEPTVWDRLMDELEGIGWGSADERGRLRAVARAAITYGMEVTK